MLIAKIIAIALSCFSLGVSIANLIWFICTRRK